MTKKINPGDTLVGIRDGVIDYSYIVTVQEETKASWRVYDNYSVFLLSKKTLSGYGLTFQKATKRDLDRIGLITRATWDSTYMNRSDEWWTDLEELLGQTTTHNE